VPANLDMAPLHPLSRPAAAPGDRWTTIEETGRLVLPGMLQLLRVRENDLEDLLQQVLLAAFTSLPRYSPRCPKARGSTARSERLASAQGQPSGPAGPWPWATLNPEQQAAARWLFGIAWRQVSHHHRACYRRHVPQGLRHAACFQDVAGTPGGDAVVEERQRRELALELLGAIAPRGRVILLLHDGYEVPLREIAELLGIKLNTASTRLRRARDEYRAAAKRLPPEEPAGAARLPPAAASGHHPGLSSRRRRYGCVQGAADRRAGGAGTSAALVTACPPCAQGPAPATPAHRGRRRGRRDADPRGLAARPASTLLRRSRGAARPGGSGRGRGSGCGA
jgi:DNA-directed RNA polymerase specialized sigma24 family protein